MEFFCFIRFEWLFSLIDFYKTKKNENDFLFHESIKLNFIWVYVCVGCMCAGHTLNALKILHSYNYSLLLLHSNILIWFLFRFVTYIVYNNIIHMNSGIRTCCDWSVIFILFSIYLFIYLIFVICFFYLNLFLTKITHLHN